ncbi:flippase [Candidatus Uhrbacteria bacterium]|nr:flippase [Candidatus Uhrbacteria bacterium]
MTNKVARNTLYLTGASIGQKIIAFIYFLFLARIMMPEQTGQYFLAISITSIFSVIADFGITSVITREIAKDEMQARSLVSNAISLKIILTITAVAVTLIASYFLHYGSTIQFLIFLASLVLVLDAFQVFFYGILRGFQSLEFESLGVFVGMLTTALFGGFILWFYPSLPLLVVALVLGSFVNVIVSLIHVARHMGWNVLIPSLNKKDLSWLLKAAFPFALAAIFVKIYSYVDTIFISKFLDPASLGFYAIAYKFTYAFQFLPMAFVAALYPGMSALVDKDPNALEAVLSRSMWYVAVISAPIVFGLYAIASEVVQLAGPEYVSATVVLQVLIFVLIPIFLDFPIGSLLNASNRQSIKTTIMGVTMIINVFLNAILIPRIGIIGAAYASLFSFLFMFLVGFYFIRSVIPNFSHWGLLKTLLPIYTSGIIMLMAVLILKPILGWIFVIPVGGVIYLFFLLFLGVFTESDKSFFKFKRHRV